ncbi:lysophospholipid acyltransferase family protein [Iodobacter ciconiae]|uniref:Lysophospholipid acyltransferase family protein n=1 Tax=Iodobacter ciconiae TaxID=2496266 RepID=A0A3S8ZVP1_9NEIS|nr:lysophospholipid acyltransferase family protein [Iodobacter ciconiae]AZN37573.1 lysophospholipid acyltransferase family protein [Iodobacter ciconiae]
MRKNLMLLLKPIAYLPLWLFHGLGALLGWLAWLLSPRYRQRLAANLQQSGIAQNGGDYKRLHRLSVSAHGMGAVELLPAWLRTPEQVGRWVKERDGWEHVEAAMQSGRPMMFVSPHLGGIEVCGVYISTQIPCVLAALYRPPKLKWLEPLMVTGRNRANGRAAPANASGVKILLRTLKEKQAIYILPDQAPGAGEGAWAPFFGKLAYTMTLLPRLSKSTQPVILMCFAERLSWGRGFKMHFAPLDEAFGGDAQADALILNRNVEAMVRRAPSQYLWSYNRYKHPAGAPLPPDLAEEGEGAAK